MEQIDQIELDKTTPLTQPELLNSQNLTDEKEPFLTNTTSNHNQTVNPKDSINIPIIQANVEFQEVCQLDSFECVEESLDPKIIVETVDEVLVLSKADFTLNNLQHKELFEEVSQKLDNADSKDHSREITSLNQPKIKRPRLSMPQLYLRTDTLANVRGFLPTDDLQIELLVPEKENQNKTWFREFRSLARDFLFAAATALLIVIFVVQPVKVEGTSMLPKLHNDERIFINKFIYQFESIKRGDIVVFWYPKNPSQSFIKRVIGVPGDEIRITNGKLFINNQPVPEPYLSPEYTSNVMPNLYKMVEEHHYFVMGDNRDASNDSRAWGLVPEKYIYGKAIFRYWPLDNAGTISD